MTLIDACHILKNRGLKFDCLIVGKGPQKELLSRRISENSLADVVIAQRIFES